MEDFKKRLSNVLAFSRFVFHWGFIPFVIYLGFNTGADEGQPPLNLLHDKKIAFVATRVFDLIFEKYWNKYQKPVPINAVINTIVDRIGVIIADYLLPIFHITKFLTKNTLSAVLKFSNN
ncbi:mitochondrial import receptor subunit TOM7 -like protein [Brachionus plicatilis]|uniref:Mitochondrial import receptor subunit TOM7 homolog n=1 Tax=Brachionus plicatilis TaxID=10195 RepID=A0A3M7QDA4_BRAPC|nr:mitochondrial import receptor subunit TOM7 -like protein [Brachionus plicatilis]